MPKITDYRIFSARSRESKPIADATHRISEITFLVVELTLDTGQRGQGYLLSFDYSPRAILGALGDMREFILSRPYRAHQTLRLLADWDAATEYFGTLGLQRWAGSVTNVAMWDAWARHLQVPIWKLLGTGSTRIPLYGSGGWLSYSIEELLEEVRGYRRRGFRAVKIKVGAPGGIDEDIERLTRCREALGPQIRIMMDANQGLDYPAALALALRAKDLGIAWFEEPVEGNNPQAYEMLRRKCDISLAMGEREYDCTALINLTGRNALDLWQPDIIRIGGVENWRASADLAWSAGIPVLPHYYKDYDVPLLASVRKPFGAESFDWIDSLIDNTMRIEDGYAYPRDGDGWGFFFREEFLEPAGE